MTKFIKRPSVKKMAPFDLETVKKFLEDGGDPNIVNEDNRTLLIKAVLLGRGSIAELLIQKDANPNLEDKFNRTALYYAANNGNEPMTRLLLGCQGCRANIKASNKKGDTALHAAARNGHYTICDMMLTVNPTSVNTVDSDLRTPLHFAAKNAYFNLCELLLTDYSAYVNVKDFMSWTPLHFAAQKGCVSTCQTLIRFGADPSALTDDEETPLHLVAKFGGMYSLSLCNLFIKKGADIDAVDANGNSAWELAAKNMHKDVEEFLVKSGATTKFLD